MKGWLATVGRLPGRDEPVDTRFQSADEPYPRHWRTPPAPWPSDTITAERLQRAVQALPDPWRVVLLARDRDGVPADQVAADHGLTEDQQRHILNLARAALRDALAAQVSE